MTKDTSLKADSAKGRILFLDDNEDTCELVNLILSQAGYQVVLGRSVADGLRLTRNKQFDLILLDWNFMDGTGIDLCRAVREFDGDTPIFFYTGMAYEHHIRTAMQAGAQGCFIKPVEMETLLKTVAERIAK
ncbi:MAG TPA: response regulator [Blastocatellia bacterium]|nr:response regulator [Blastocatellia bacterium]